MRCAKIMSGLAVSQSPTDPREAAASRGPGAVTIASYGSWYTDRDQAARHGRKEDRHAAPLGDATRRNPRDALHNSLDGRPGVEMPPLRARDEMQTLVDILADVQTLPDR